MPTKSIIERIKSTPDGCLPAISFKDFDSPAEVYPKYYAIYISKGPDDYIASHIKEFDFLWDAISYAYELCPTEPENVTVINGLEIYTR